MTDILFVDDNPPTEDELITLLRNKNYNHLMRFLDINYRSKFRAEQSGESFENCINWCSQNTSNLENAKEVVLRLFDRYYRQLPLPVENLKYLAEEVGYAHSNSNLSKLKDRSKGLATVTKTAYNVMVKQVQDYAAELRQRRQPQAQVFFRETVVSGPKMHQEIDTQSENSQGDFRLSA